MVLTSLCALLVLFLQQALWCTQLKAQEPVLVIPCGTKIQLVLETPIDSRTVVDGYKVTAHPTEDMAIDGKTVLSKDAKLSGSVTNVKHQSQRDAFQLGFDRLTLPNGQEISIDVCPLVRASQIKVIHSGQNTLFDAAHLTIDLDPHPSSPYPILKPPKLTSAALISARRHVAVELTAGDEIKTEVDQDIRIPSH